MKRLAITAALLAAALLTGCGTQPQENGSSKAETEPAAQVSTEETTQASEEATTEPLFDENATPPESFVYEIKDGYAVITDFKGKETEVIVPSRLEGVPVTQIGQYAFEACWNVVSVEIPETVDFIGEQAFLDCESLESVNIPSKVTTLRRATFAGCTALMEMTIPETVTATDEELFIGCPLEVLYVENPDLPYASWGLEELEVPCTICAPEGAKILTWAERSGFPTENLS